MSYYEMTTEQLENLKSAIEEKLDTYVGMSFASPRSEYVTYEIDFIDSDEILINANHCYNGLIRDYTVDILDGVNDDVEYNLYNAEEEIVDGGYMSFDRLPKIIRNAVLEIYALYKELEKLDNILDTRAEEEEEEPEEDKEVHYIANVLGFDGFDYDDAKAKLENDDSILGTHAEEEEEEEEVTKEKTLKFTIKSSKLGKEINFFRAEGCSYVYADLNGGHGTTGNQICKGGKLLGNTISYYGNDLEGFKRVCHNWLKQYLLR